MMTTTVSMRRERNAAVRASAASVIPVMSDVCHLSNCDLHHVDRIVFDGPRIENHTVRIHRDPTTNVNSLTIVSLFNQPKTDK